MLSFSERLTSLKNVHCSKSFLKDTFDIFSKCQKNQPVYLFFLINQKRKTKKCHLFFCLRKKNRQWQCWIRDDLIENLIFFKFIFQILFGSLVERKPKFGSGTNTPAHWERYGLLTYFWYIWCVFTDFYHNFYNLIFLRRSAILYWWRGVRRVSFWVIDFRSVT